MRTRRVNSELLPGKKNEVQVDTLFPPLWIFESTVLFGYVVYNAVWLLLYFVIFVLLFVAILMPTNDAPFLSSKKDWRKISGGNFSFTLVIFILYLMHYDEQGTNKTGWSDFFWLKAWILGMLGKAKLALVCTKRGKFRSMLRGFKGRVTWRELILLQLVGWSRQRPPVYDSVLFVT